jgi:hypothetical protein
MTETRTRPHESGPEDQQLLDRLIDGELSPEARRDLLLRLEHETGGWRRCALAFLEAQSWGQDFGAMLNQPVGAASEGSVLAAAVNATTSVAHLAPVSASAASTSTSSTSRRWLDRAGTLLAIAASFVIAFGLGVASKRLPDGSDRVLDGGGGMVAANRPVAPSRSVDTSVAATATTTSAPTTQSAAPNELASAVGAAIDAAADRKPTDNTDDDSPIWLPSGLADEASLLGDEPAPAVPAYVRRALERSGHAIEQQQELWPVQLENGSHALVPVERVKVRYVGNDFE